jgi:hypothetical protein
MPRPLLIAAAALAGTIAIAPIGLFACSERREAADSRESLRSFDVEEAPAPARALAAPAAPPSAMQPMAAPPPAAPASVAAASEAPTTPNGALPETAPRIAYTYGYSFRLPTAAIAAVQERHLQICRDLGEARCRVAAMNRSARAAPSEPGAEPGTGPRTEPRAQAQVTASLQLQVAAPLAARFGEALSAATGRAGGEIGDRTIAAEDVSHDMVDHQARIRTRETLIRRLSALLETRSGNIQQAVEAERAINQAQEELDSARNWLAETEGRVAMTRFEISYEAAAPAAIDETSADPLATSFSRVGSLTTQSFAAILLIAGLLLPWALIGGGIFWLARWWQRRVAASQLIA